MRTALKHILRNNLFFVVIAMLSSCVNEPNNQIAADSYKVDTVETKAIVKYYIKYELKKDSILMLENPYEFTTTLSLKKVIHDLGLRNRNLEESVLNSQRFNQSWFSFSMPFVKLINRHDVKHNLRSETGYDNLKKAGYDGFYVFSRPILLKPQLAVMDIEFHCGNRCGYNTLVSFKKETSGWRIFKRYQDVIF